MQVDSMQWIALTGGVALLFALVHIYIGRLTFLDVLPRSRWLSFAGGVAVAYVFLHILPELSAHQGVFAEALATSENSAEHWVYLVAFGGLAVFYGLERAVKTSRKASRNDRVATEILWLHVAAFGLYNMLIGYLLLHREEPGLGSLFVYAIAMALHFMTNDYGLRKDQKDQYDAAGRWVIAGAVLLGWVLGLAVAVPEIIIGVLFSFLAGGVVLNVLKEELPEERESRFVPFLAGGIVCAALLLMV